LCCWWIYGVEVRMEWLLVVFADVVFSGFIFRFFFSPPMMASARAPPEGLSCCALSHRDEGVRSPDGSGENIPSRFFDETRANRTKISDYFEGMTTT